MTDNLQKETALIEAILFVESEAIGEARLSRISGLSREIIKEVLVRIGERYAMKDSGIELSNISEGIMISPKREYWENLKDQYGKKNENKISRAEIETLSIIAYRQPITKAEIKGYRGVNPDNMVKLLLDKKLIDRVGKKDIPGKPSQYGTTKEFLKLFRLNSIADLPRLSESDQERFELEGEL